MLKLKPCECALLKMLYGIIKTADPEICCFISVLFVFTFGVMLLDFFCHLAQCIERGNFIQIRGQRFNWLLRSGRWLCLFRFGRSIRLPLFF